MTVPEEQKMSYYQLMQYARISTLYHRRRQDFYETWETISKALTLILGSGSAFAVLKQQYQFEAAFLAFAVAVVSAIALVVGTSRKATLHNSLARRWLDLESQLISTRGDEERICDLEAKIPQIEQDEPPELGGLIRVCTREVLRSKGHPEAELPQIPLRQRLLAHWVDFQTTG
jgi:hypothetical protein